MLGVETIPKGQAGEAEASAHGASAQNAALARVIIVVGLGQLFRKIGDLGELIRKIGLFVRGAESEMNERSRPAVPRSSAVCGQAAAGIGQAEVTCW